MSGIERRLRVAETKIVGPLPLSVRRYAERAAAEHGLDPDDVVRETVRLLAQARERGAHTAEAMARMIAAETGADPAVLIAETAGNLARWNEGSAA